METNGINSLGYDTVNTKHQLQQLRNKIAKNEAKKEKQKQKQKQQQQNKVKQPFLDCMEPSRKRRRISKQRNKSNDILSIDSGEVCLPL